MIQYCTENSRQGKKYFIFFVMNNFEKLEVFQKSYKLALFIHKIAKEWPKEIQFTLTDQILRASKSIPANIAEGYGKQVYSKEFKRFLIISSGSKDEMKVHIMFLKDLGYIDMDIFQKLTKGYDEVGRMLHGLINSIK